MQGCNLWFTQYLERKNWNKKIGKLWLWHWSWWGKWNLCYSLSSLLCKIQNLFMFVVLLYLGHMWFSKSSAQELEEALQCSSGLSLFNLLSFYTKKAMIDSRDPNKTVKSDTVRKKDNFKFVVYPKYPPSRFWKFTAVFNFFFFSSLFWDESKKLKVCKYPKQFRLK